jgi:hypothetical protein
MIRSKTVLKGILIVAVLCAMLAATNCDGNVYMGVGVAGPYGYPYGGYGPGYGAVPVYGGGVYVGRPF